MAHRRYRRWHTPDVWRHKGQQRLARTDVQGSRRARANATATGDGSLDTPTPPIVWTPADASRRVATRSGSLEPWPTNRCPRGGPEQAPGGGGRGAEGLAALMAARPHAPTTAPGG